MKNLHYLKKFVVMVLAAMMTLSTFAMPTFAADTTMTINGVTNEDGDFDSEADVVGYKVVNQKANGEWEMVKTFGTYDETDKKWYINGTSNPKLEFKLGEKDWKPGAKELAALAKLASGEGDISFTANKAKKSFESTGSEVGSWLVIVTPGQVGTIYNPMIVSRDYTAAGTVEATANAKKSNIPFEKVVDREGSNLPPTNTPNDNVTGDGLQGNDGVSPKDANFDNTNDGNLGDTAGTKGGKVTLNDDGTATFSHEGQEFDNVAFRIGTKFPNYADNYYKADSEGKYPAKVGDFYNPTFVINDKLSDGLTLEKDSIVVKVDGKEVKSGFTIKYNEKYKETDTDTKDFIVIFDAELIKANPEKLVEVCYSAKLNKDHGVNFDGEKNTAELHYSTKPGKDTTKDEERETYHYTFTINGNVDAKAKKENREVIKIGLDESNNWVMKETVAVEEEDWHPLKGVKFKLTKENNKNAEAVKEVVTDKDGILRGMDQLDAGVYYLFETSLGKEEENKKYSVKETAIKIEIKAELDAKGRLSKYQVIAGQDGGEQILVGNYEKVYEGDAKGVYFLDQNGNRIAKMDADGNVTDIGPVARHVIEEKSIDDTDTQAADIVNTPVGTLPSTGGMGTVLFTIGGIVIMGLALLLLFGGKKKQQQK